MALHTSNEYVKSLIESNESFLISRVGNLETKVAVEYDSNGNVNSNVSCNLLHNNAGIYCNNMEELNTYAKLHAECIQNSTALASFGSRSTNTNVIFSENHFVEKYKLKTVHSRILEPYYCIEQDLIPWSHSLLGKKVLVINPFVDSMQQQLKNGFQIFKHQPLFLEGQEIIFYKCFSTNGMNRTHNNWIETFEIMCNDISKLDFDIALLGCGGYGLPLCNYIHKNLNKSAIYVGGGLQLLFGVMGRRWESRDFWKTIIAENGCTFVRPSKEEQITGQNAIENACYW